MATPQQWPDALTLETRERLVRVETDLRNFRHEVGEWNERLDRTLDELNGNVRVLTQQYRRFNEIVSRLRMAGRALLWILGPAGMLTALYRIAQSLGVL